LKQRSVIGKPRKIGCFGSEKSTHFGLHQIQMG